MSHKPRLVLGLSFLCGSQDLAEDANDETVEGGESENDLANDECIDVHPMPSLDMLLPPGPVDPSNADTLVMETPSPSPPGPKRTLQDDQAALDQMIAEMEYLSCIVIMDTMQRYTCRTESLVFFHIGIPECTAEGEDQKQKAAGES